MDRVTAAPSFEESRGQGAAGPRGAPPQAKRTNHTMTSSRRPSSDPKSSLFYNPGPEYFSLCSVRLPAPPASARPSAALAAARAAASSAARSSPSRRVQVLCTWLMRSAPRRRDEYSSLCGVESVGGPIKQQWRGACAVEGRKWSLRRGRRLGGRGAGKDGRPRPTMCLMRSVRAAADSLAESSCSRTSSRGRSRRREAASCSVFMAVRPARVELGFWKSAPLRLSSARF